MANIVGKYGMGVMLPYMKTIAACYITCALFTVFVQGGLMAGLYGPFFLGHERSNAFCICNLLQRGNDTIKLKMHERVRCQ